MKQDEQLKTFCPLPWLHLSANQDESLRICCNTSTGGFIYDEAGKRMFLHQVSSVQDYFNKPFMKDLRLKMLRGERHSHCSSCHGVEDLGGRSVRLDFIDIWKDKIPSLIAGTSADGTIDPKIHYIDFAFGNTCNLKCRMCNPSASILLEKEFKALDIPFDREYVARVSEGWKVDEKFQHLIASALPTTEQILVTGGEPLVTKEHFAILEKAVELGVAGNITLVYHTNLTVLPTRLLELWAQFKQVSLHCSIEGYGKLNEYIRYPSKWDAVDRNFRKLMDLRQVIRLSLEVHTTCQVYNMLGLVDLMEYLLSFDGKIPPLPHFILLTGPHYLSIKSVPKELKILARDRILGHFKKNRDRYLSGPHATWNRSKMDTLIGYLTYFMEDDGDPVRFREYTAKLDSSRGQRIEDFIPELKSISPEVQPLNV